MPLPRWTRSVWTGSCSAYADIRDGFQETGDPIGDAGADVGADFSEQLAAQGGLADESVHVVQEPVDAAHRVRLQEGRGEQYLVDLTTVIPDREIRSASVGLDHGDTSFLGGDSAVQ